MQRFVTATVALLLLAWTVRPAGAVAAPPAGPIGGAQFDSLVTRPDPAPGRVEISELFLAFDSSIPRRTIPRRRAAADSLARHVLAAARAGADFDSLVQAHSDLKRGFRFELADERRLPAASDRGRQKVEPAVRDLAFGMSVGETGLVIPDGARCRFGYYVIHRWK